MTTIATQEFLAHHGVKGMHWGVRKEQDSAGGSSSRAENKQARREAGAQKFEKRAAEYQTQISKIENFQAKTAYGRHVASNELKEYGKLKATALKDADAKRNGKLTSTQKKVIAGAAIVAAIVAGAAIYKGLDSGDFQRLAAKGRDAVATAGTGLKRNEKLASKDLSPDLVHSLVVKGVNPGYGAVGTKNNCRRATFAYEMRRRGYDVRATRTAKGTGQNLQGLANAVTPGSKKSTNDFAVALAGMRGQKLGVGDGPLGAAKSVKSSLTGDHVSEKIKGLVSAKDVFDSLGKEPNGSRGELAVKWLGGGAHSLAYEIFDGKPVVFDTQNGSKYDTVESMVKGAGGYLKAAGHTRLDDKELNTDFLKRWVK
jgi:hypothetical protein